MRSADALNVIFLSIRILSIMKLTMEFYLEFLNPTIYATHSYIHRFFKQLIIFDRSIWYSTWANIWNKTSSYAIFLHLDKDFIYL